MAGVRRPVQGARDNVVGHREHRQLTRVLIAADPGTDDALAIMMALGSPDLDVLGITTVGGNATLMSQGA